MYVATREEECEILKVTRGMQRETDHAVATRQRRASGGGGGGSGGLSGRMGSGKCQIRGQRKAVVGM